MRPPPIPIVDVLGVDDAPCANAEAEEVGRGRRFTEEGSFLEPLRRKLNILPPELLVLEADDDAGVILVGGD